MFVILGLTDAEITEAIERCGGPAAVTAAAVAPPMGASLVPAQNVPSVWERLREFLTTAVVVGGFAYAVAQFIKVGIRYESCFLEIYPTIYMIW